MKEQKHHLKARNVLRCIANTISLCLSIYHSINITTIGRSALVFCTFIASICVQTFFSRLNIIFTFSLVVEGKYAENAVKASDENFCAKSNKIFPTQPFLTISANKYMKPARLKWKLGCEKTRLNPRNERIIRTT